MLQRPRTNLVLTKGINADFETLGQDQTRRRRHRTVVASEGHWPSWEGAVRQEQQRGLRRGTVRSRWARAPVSLLSLGNLQIWKENVKIPGDTSDTSLHFKSHHANNGLLPTARPFWGLLTQRKLPALCWQVPACSSWFFSPGVSVPHYQRITQPEASGWGFVIVCFCFVCLEKVLDFFIYCFYIIQNEMKVLP